MGKVILFFFILLTAFRANCAEDKLVYIKTSESSSFYLDTLNLPKDAFPAICYSIAMLDSVIFSDIPIKVKIKFAKTSRENVLAIGEATSYEIGFSDLAHPSFFYPISLAEKIANKNMNGDNVDISVVVNEGINWHYGIEPAGVEGKFDLISILTHEMTHGLGFQSLVSVFNHSVDTSRKLSIFDSFIVDGLNNHLYPNSYMQGPAVAYHVITKDALYFKSPHYNLIYPDSLIALYSPKIYAAGNSIHHLDDKKNQYVNNKLMRPGFARGDYLRQIDVQTKSILHDLGWSRPGISHTKPFDVDFIESSQELRFSSSSNSENFTVDYSFDRFVNHKKLIAEYKENAYRVVIPALEFNHTVSYRLQYEDTQLGHIYLPCDTCAITYQVGRDTVKPILSRLTISPVYVGTKDVTLKGFVSDNTGKLSLRIIAFQSNRDSVTIAHDTLGNSSFEYTYSLGNIDEYDTVAFRFIVADCSKQQNMTIADISKVVYHLGDIRKSYSTDFENASLDFILDGFSLIKNSGFSSTSLNTEHFYKAPNVEQDTLFTYAYLKPRIILDDVHHFMTFDEIVLVEPKDDGKLFGEFGYWDFVSVEGSSDNGLTWHIFGKEGYDASTNNAWNLPYLQDISYIGKNKNSSFVPTEDLYRPRKINLVENKHLRKNDTVTIRFKLTSDAFSTGWGWSIDNLVIQAGAVSVDSNSKASLAVFPNPFTSAINIAEGYDGMPYQIVSVTGILVASGTVVGSTIPLENIPSGMCILRVLSGGSVHSQSIIKQSLD